MTVKLNHSTMSSYSFLEGMYRDPYFPDFLVDRGKLILLQCCERIETTKPSTLDELYTITHAATEQFNELACAFYEHDSEIETAARDCIGTDFAFLAQAYGFDADPEELIAPRDW